MGTQSYACFFIQEKSQKQERAPCQFICELLSMVNDLKQVFDRQIDSDNWLAKVGKAKGHY